MAVAIGGTVSSCLESALAVGLSLRSRGGALDPAVEGELLGLLAQPLAGEDAPDIHAGVGRLVTVFRAIPRGARIPLADRLATTKAGDRLAHVFRSHLPASTQARLLRVLHGDVLPLPVVHDAFIAHLPSDPFGIEPSPLVVHPRIAPQVTAYVSLVSDHGPPSDAPPVHAVVRVFDEDGIEWGVARVPWPRAMPASTAAVFTFDRAGSYRIETELIQRGLVIAQRGRAVEVIQPGLELVKRAGLQAAAEVGGSGLSMPWAFAAVYLALLEGGVEADLATVMLMSQAQRRDAHARITDDLAEDIDPAARAILGSDRNLLEYAAASATGDAQMIEQPTIPPADQIALAGVDRPAIEVSADPPFLRRWVERAYLAEGISGVEALPELVADRAVDDFGITRDPVRQAFAMQQVIPEMELQIQKFKLEIDAFELLDFGIAKRDCYPEVAPDSDSDENCAPDRDGVTTERLPVRPRRAGRTVVCYDSESRRRLTPPGAFLGSHPYMAHEQWIGADVVGPAADIYSLGVIIYQALTGRLPFVADRPGDYYEQHKRAPVPPLGDNFPPDLDPIIRCALDKLPKARHGSALELAADLQRVLRTSRREQLRISAQQWHDQAGAPGLLWGADVLEDALRSVPREALSPLECSFVAESEQRIRRARWVWRSLVALAAVIAVGGLLYISTTQAHQATLQTRLAQEQTRLAQEQTRSTQRVAEATITQAELEQGRSALLHGEPDAPIHLARVYQHGDHSPSTEFMLARALQPRLAEQARFASTFGRMWSATFSPDGHQIATTDDRDAQIRNAQTGRLLFTLPHGKEVYQAVYSSDGSRLVTVTGNAVRIWNASNGALVHKLGDNKTSEYFVTAISPDGKLVSAIDLSGSLAHVWDAVTGAPIVDLRNDPMDFPGIAFSSDGHWLATTGGNDVRIFDTRTWRTALTIRGPRIRRLAFDSTGTRIITGAITGDASIWSIPNGARLQHLRDGREPVDAVAFSPDGQLAVTGSRGGEVQVWRAGSGELQSQLTPRPGKILAVEFDRASKLVLSTSADGAVVVSDAYLGVPVAELEDVNSVLIAHFDPTSRRVVSASLDGIAQVWDASSPYRRWSSPPVANDCNQSPTSTSDGRFVAIDCRGRATRVWDTERDQLVAELPSASEIAGDFLSASPVVSSAGDRAAIPRGNTVKVYELPGGRLLATVSHGAPVSAVAFAPTDRDLVSGATDGSLIVTRDDGTRLSLPTSLGGIDTIGVLSDGLVITADAQRRLRVYDPSGAVLAEIEVPARVRSLLANGDRLVAVPMPPHYVGTATSPLLLNLKNYRVAAQLDGHVGRVFSARWVAGDQILTAGADGTARLWDGSTGQLRHTYRGRSRILTTVTLAPDGFVMAGGADGLLQFWDKDSERLLWMFRAHASPIVGLKVEGSDIVTGGFASEFSRWTLPSPGQVIGACVNHEHCAIVLR